MKKITRVLLYCGILLMISNGVFSQKTTTKPNTKNKEVPPPPPPRKDPPGVKMQKVDSTELPPDVEELQDAKIPGRVPVDTVPPPNDELTIELRKMLETTGALNLGVQFAKNLEELQSGQNVLPREFYERMYKALSTGDGKRWFENAIIKVYRKHLTVQDVKDLNTFYATPTGKKYVGLLPVFLDESKQAGANIGQYLGLMIYQQLLQEGKLD